MQEEWRLVYAIGGLLIASGLLTYLTKPAEAAPFGTRKKRRKKIRLRDARPYLTEEGFVALNIDKEQANRAPLPTKPHID